MPSDAYPMSEERPSEWPAPGKHAPDTVAAKFNDEICKAVAAGRKLKLVGLLANEDPAGEVYARMTKRACERLGIEYELRRPERLHLERSILDANADPSVHGILTYYPVFGGGKDAYLRDVISLEKDVEGLSHRYCYSLYHNIRHLEGTADKKCVLPCTPLACVKVLESLGAYSLQQPVGKQLRGRTAIIYNRSEVVGRPLAAMLANDGALVYSVDEFGMLVYSAGAVHGAIKVEETSVSPDEALASADIVVGGVPAKAFKLPAEKLKRGAICINVAQHMNFGDGVEAKCALVPAVGKVTIAILARNLLRLYDNFHAPPATRVALSPRTLVAAKRPTVREVGGVLAISAVALGIFYAGYRYGSNAAAAASKALLRAGYPSGYANLHGAPARVGYARPA